jgi:predicted N-acetyltransferase YhbS
VIVRLERPDDRVAASEVERAAFAGQEEAEIVERVRDEPGSFALVAEDAGTVVGHVQLSRAWVGPDPVLALGPIGVLPERQGGGIGAALVRSAIDEARRRGEIAVILLGSPVYYRKLGFRAASGRGLRNPFAGTTEDGSRIEEEDFQIAVIDETRASTLAGDVRWHPAFG